MSSTPEVTQPPETTAATTPVPQRTAAPGVIPKQMQSWIFLSVILVVAAGMWFSSSARNNSAPNANSPAEPQLKPIVGGLTPEEIQKRLQESEESRQTGLKNLHPNQPADDDPRFTTEATYQPQPVADQTSARDPIEEDERKREYAGRFASNIALSYRSDMRAGASNVQLPAGALPSTSDPAELATATVAQSGLPSLPVDFKQQLEILQAQQEKLLAQEQQQLAAATAPSEGPQATPQSQPQTTPAAARHNADLNAATGKQHVIFEGTVLESVLVNRLNGDFAGPVICQITTDLYSHDHSELLIPAGTRILGESKKVNDVGQERLAVIFHRLIMPDGYSVDLDQAPGLNQIGETALRDKVNNHYFRIFGASIAIGAIAGLATIGANNSAVTGLPTSNASAYREGVAGSLSQSSLQILNRFLNIPPTITIREGHRVRIFLTQDLLLPAYSNHRMPSDL